uniref:Carboxylesterase type B domain-containing protein n=1 Tax=Panagrolaimus superbus TaxID=310955 RepID=A0A914Y0L1_9BILA
MWAVSARPVAAEFCQNLAIKLGYKRQFTGPWTAKENKAMIEFLKDLSPQKFAMTMVGCQTVFEKMRLDVSPVVDGEILPAPPYILRQTAPIRLVMMGVTESEGLIFCKLFYYLKFF